MKKIGIIGAMEEEITAIKDKMQVKETKKIASMEFYNGVMENKPLVLVRCGIGKVNAAICTQVLIDHFDVDYVVNVGVAGAIADELEIGDIVISTDAAHHDFDVTVFGHNMGVIPRMNESFFHADQFLIDLAKQAAEGLDKKLKVYVARVASGDQFISSGEMKAIIWKHFNAYCAEMEGAAIAHTCYLNEVPFVIIRSISDKADHSADVNFNEFVQWAAQNSSDMIMSMIENME